MNLHKQNFVCWPSVGPQDIKQTYIHTYTSSRCACAAVCCVGQMMAGDKVQLNFRMSGITNVRVKKRKAGVTINAAAVKEVMAAA